MLTTYFDVQTQKGDAAVAVEARNTEIRTSEVEGMIEKQPGSSSSPSECEKTNEEDKY